MARWNRELFEIPDVVGFDDFCLCAKQADDELQARILAPAPSELLTFPYPNTPAKLRSLSVLAPEDLIVLRSLGGRVIGVIDAALSPAVCSYRLGATSPCWAFQEREFAWKKRFVGRALGLLGDSAFDGMCRTDVKLFYPSVCINVLDRILKGLPCDRFAVNRILHFLRFWQKDHGDLGLPIGPEVSAILGNAVLASLDRAIEAAGVKHLRYGDDVLAFSNQNKVYGEVLPAVDGELRKLGLCRSIEKTEYYDDVEQAAESLRSGRLASLGSALRSDKESSTNALQRAFDEEILGAAEPSVSTFRYVVNALANHGNAYGCRSLSQRADFLNLDPKVSADYFEKTADKTAGLRDPRLVDKLMEHLTGRAGDRFEGLRLHLLRALAGRRRRLGQAEAKEFHRIAADSFRRWPVRNWAWKAYAKTSQDAAGIMEAAREEKNRNVRRAMILCLRGRARRSFLHHAAEHFPECRYAVRWLRAA